MRLFFVTFAICLLVCVLHNASMLTTPLLGWDEVLIFNDFFSGKGSLFYVYPDNVSLAPNIAFLIGFKAFRLPVLPAALEWMAIAFFASMSAVPSLSAFETIIRDPCKRVLLAVWIAAMPVSNFSLLLAPSYQNWSSLIPVFLFTGLLVATASLARARVSPWWLTLLVPCAMTNPLSVAAAPFGALAALIAWRKGRIGTASTAAGLALAGLTAAALVPFTSSPRAGASAIGVAQVWEAAWRAGLFLLDRGLVEAVLGSTTRQAVLDLLPPAGPGLAPVALYVAAVCGCVGLAAFARRRSRREVIVFGATLVAVAFTFSFLVLITLGPMRGLQTGDSNILTAVARYWFIQKVVILVSIGALLLEAPALPARLSRYATSLALGAFLMAYAANADTGGRYGPSSQAVPQQAERRARSDLQRAVLEAAQAASRRNAVACLAETGDPAFPRLRLALPQGSGPPAATGPACVSP